MTAAAAALALCLFLVQLAGVGARLFEDLGVLLHHDRRKVGRQLRCFLLGAPLGVAGDGGVILGDGGIGLLRLAVAQDADVAVFVADDSLRLLLQTDLHTLTQQIHVRDGAAAVGRIHKGLRLGRGLEQILIGCLLIVQAAHQAAAGAGNFGRIQTEILRFCHLDGHRLEIVEKFAAAEGTAANAQTADQLCLVAHADLTQLNARAQDGGQLLDQLAEVHAPVGGEKEENLAAVKGILRRDELHFQPESGNFLLADLHCALFAQTVVGVHAAVLRGGDADDRTQRRDDVAWPDLVVAADAAAELRPAGGVDHDVVPGAYLECAGVKEIGFCARAELNGADRDRLLRLLRLFGL